MKQADRIELLDLGRGLALVAMTIFHFAFDLELFGIQDQGFISQPHWKYFARVIATSFLFLTGFSLLLAHRGEIRWKSWRLRMLKIVAASMVITLATYFATPNQYIFFGILHAIAFASVAGLLAIRLPVILTVMIAGIIFTVGLMFQTEWLNHWVWWWSGLSSIKINSSDYVPVFPWFCAPLLGIAAAKLIVEKQWLDQIAAIKFTSIASGWLKFMGRNSLIYYLLHQPCMIALIVVYLYLTGKFPG